MWMQNTSFIETGIFMLEETWEYHVCEKVQKIIWYRKANASKDKKDMKLL